MNTAAKLINSYLILHLPHPPPPQTEVTLLRSEVAQLKQLLLAHKDCPVTALQKKSDYHSE